MGRTWAVTGQPIPNKTNFAPPRPAYTHTQITDSRASGSQNDKEKSQTSVRTNSKPELLYQNVTMTDPTGYTMFYRLVWL